MSITIWILVPYQTLLIMQWYWRPYIGPELTDLQVTWYSLLWSLSMSILFLKGSHICCFMPRLVTESFLMDPLLLMTSLLRSLLIIIPCRILSPFQISAGCNMSPFQFQKTFSKTSLLWMFQWFFSNTPLLLNNLWNDSAIPPMILQYLPSGSLKKHFPGLYSTSKN